MKSSLALIIVWFGFVSGTSSAIMDDAESAEFGRKAVRQPRRVEDIVASELFFRELADEDVLLAYSMSMSMSMADALIPTTAAPSTAVPTSAPTVANVTVEASDGPSIAPSTAASLIPLTDDSVESVLASDARRESVSGSPASTAVVAMASAGGIILAVLAIRRSRAVIDLEDLDNKKDGSTVDDEEFFGTEPSVAGCSASTTV